MTAATPPPPSGPPASVASTIAAADPTKVAGRRIGAWILDAMIGGLLVLGGMLTTGTNTAFDNSITAELQCDFINDFTDDACIQSGSTLYLWTGDDIGILFLIWVGASVLLTMVIPAFTGWSPGKRLLGLRIVDQETFELAGIGPNLLRGLLWIVDGFGYFTGPLVGGIAMFSSDGSRRVGDMAAKTLVVKAEHVGRPVAVRNVNSLDRTTQAPVFIVGAPQPSGPTYAPPQSAPPISAASPPSSSPPPPSGPPVSMVSEPQPSPPATGAPPVFPTPDTAEPAPPTGPLAAHQPPPPTSAPSTDVEPAVAPAETMSSETNADASAEPSANPETEAAVVPNPPPQADAPSMPAEPPSPTARPGVDTPMWDDARDTYIQWDPELEEWMMWSESSSRWIPISR